MLEWKGWFKHETDEGNIPLGALGLPDDAQCKKDRDTRVGDEVPGAAPNLCGEGGLHLRALRGVLTNEERFKKALAPLVIGPPERDVSIVDLNHGKALCIVDLVDCIPTADLVSTLFPPNPEEIAFGDYTEDRYGWITTNLRRFERPFPIKGGQRIFNVPMEVIEGHALIEGTSASMSSRT